MTIPKIYLAIKDRAFGDALGQLWCRQSNTMAIGVGNNLGKLPEDLKAVEADVLVLDICLIADNLLEIIQTLRQICPRTRILVITAGGHEGEQVPVLLAGAHGFLYQPFSLFDAVQLLHAGKLFFDAAALAEALKAGLKLRESYQSSDLTERYQISEQDLEFIKLVKQGFSTAEIAKRLNIKVKAVYQRRFRLKSRFNLGSSREFPKFAHKVIPGEPFVAEVIPGSQPSAPPAVAIAG